jgi:hypothetical protein
MPMMHGTPSRCSHYDRTLSIKSMRVTPSCTLIITASFAPFWAVDSTGFEPAPCTLTGCCAASYTTSPHPDNTGNVERVNQRKKVDGKHPLPVYNYPMSKRPDLAYVADLTNRLLKAKADVKALQHEWEALFPIDATARASSPSHMKAPTTVGRILALLDREPFEALTSDDVAERLSILNKNSVATTLSKLVRKGKLKKQGTDKYTSQRAPDANVISFSVAQSA